MKLGPGVARLGVIILLLILWEVGARLFGDPLFMSPPSDVVVSLIGLADNLPVLEALRTTLYELVTAFALAVVVGVPLGLVLGLRRFARDSFYPIVLMLYAIPQATVLPLVILAFGIGSEFEDRFRVHAFRVSHNHLGGGGGAEREAHAPDLRPLDGREPVPGLHERHPAAHDLRASSPVCASP